MGKGLLEHVRLLAKRAFRTRQPLVPLLPRRSLAYFTRPDADSAEISSKIRSTLLPYDDYSLTLEPYVPLV